jgi:hypothetical protein
MKIYRKFQFADLKRVSRAYISKLIKAKRLITKDELGEECIVDCQENDAMFARPSHNRKRKVKNK